MWARDNRPLYGVVLLLVLHVVITLASFAFESSESAVSKPPLNNKEKLGLYLDIWVMPIAMIFVVHWVCNRLNAGATLKNVLWVMIWSQLPVMLLSLISIPMELAGMNISEPLMANKLTTVDGLLTIDPPTPHFNTDGVIYFVISTVLLLWSFQILLSGISGVAGVTVKKALWILTVAMILLMLIRLPVTILLGDRDILDVLGLKGILAP